MTNIEELKEPPKSILKTVRGAYRLLAEYQRQSLDMIKYIFDSIKDSPLHKDKEIKNLCFHKWQPSHFDTTPQTTSHPAGGRWAWDFLPLYDFATHYVSRVKDHRKADIECGEWMLSIRIQSDDGFEEEKGKNEPKSKNFENIDKCKTTLSLNLAYSLKKMPNLNWVYDIYWSDEWPDEENEEPSKFFNDDLIGIQKTYNLEEIIDKKTLDDVISEFNDYITKINDRYG